MQININGEATQLTDSATLSQLAQSLGLNLTKVAIEINGEIIPKSRYDKTSLLPGDQVEVVQFIGGG